MFSHIFYFKHPTTILIVGPTQCGKTEFVIRLLNEKSPLIRPAPNRIIWAYGHKNEYQMKRILNAPPSVELIEGIPDLSDIDPNQNNLLILDDLMEALGKNSKTEDLFTVKSHHNNMTIIAIIHNLFNQKKNSRTMSLNTHYHVLFKSPRDAQQIQYFGRQIFPTKKNFIADSFRQATETPFGYLILDLHPTTKDSLRTVTGIFSNEIPQIYIPTTS